MKLSRRRMLKMGGAALGAATLGPRVTATPSEDRFVLDVGETVSERDVVAAQRSGLEVVRTIDQIGFMSVRGSSSDVQKLDYDWERDYIVERTSPDVNGAAPTLSDVDVDPSDVDPEDLPFDAPDPDSGHFSPPAGYIFQWDKITQFLSDALRTADGSGRRIGVIDSGVYAGHPDLDVNMSLSMNLTTDSKDAGPYGGYHGSHVSGIASANGSTNAVGTAPGAEVLSYRTFTSISGESGASLFDYAFAMVDAALKGCDSVNISVGFPALFPPASRGGSGVGELIKDLLESGATAAREEGTVVVNSAGNSSLNLDQPGIGPFSEMDNVLTVSATGPQGYLWRSGGLKSPFSMAALYTNVGDAAIDLAAHGGNYDPEAAASGTPGWYYDLVFNTMVEPDLSGGSHTAEWGWVAGTSMAAPQVAGAVALLRDANPEYTPQDVYDAMAYTTETASAGGYQPVSHGSGQLRPDRAVTADLSRIRTGSGRGPESGRGGRSGRGSGRGGTYCEGETRGSSETRCDGSSGAGGGRSSGGSSGGGRGKGSGRGDAGSRG